MKLEASQTSIIIKYTDTHGVSIIKRGVPIGWDTNLEFEEKNF